MGFQWMSQSWGNNYDSLLTSFDAWNVSYPLDFTDQSSKSSFVTSMPENIRSILADRQLNVTMNNHHWGVSPANFDKYLGSQFNLISTNEDRLGQTFVSSMQHKLYPVLGVQWHPEKNNFEYAMSGDSFHEAIPHTLEAVLTSQFTATFFVHQCRFNGNTFANWKELQAKLIYNYSSVRDGLSFIEMYFFDTWVF
jgi:gamma-glutamyl hydrolase